MNHSQSKPFLKDERQKTDDSLVAERDKTNESLMKSISSTECQTDKKVQSERRQTDQGVFLKKSNVKFLSVTHSWESMIVSDWDWDFISLKCLSKLIMEIYGSVLNSAKEALSILLFLARRIERNKLCYMNFY